MRSKIVVLDFGSQYAHLIAKRFRMLGYYSEIALPSSDLSVFENCRGIVFSGGPSSVYDEKVPEFNSQILNLDIPVLGLCYGHYIVQLGYGGKVSKADVGEFGFAELKLNPDVKSPLFEGIDCVQQVWMSHQDGVFSLGEGFEAVGSTKDCPFAATQNLSKKRFSLQFHCEVKDTPCGDKIFENFAKFCKMEKNWDQDTVLQVILDGIKKDAKDKKVLLFLSGGVDSTITFALLNNALGQERVLGLHIDNGFMRKNESKNVSEAYKKFGFNNFIVEDASNVFLDAVKGLTDPQKKRMAIGETFISVRNKVVEKLNLNEDDWLLAQGTLYPDIIESGGTKNSNTIKTHHNRVQGIQNLIEKGLIIEPIKELYKDEVRTIGKKLGLDDSLVMRHPFPGPGLSINVLCNSEKALSEKDEKEFLSAQKELDSVVLDQFCENCSKFIKKSVIPCRSVGVQGDFRTYRFPACLTFRPEGKGFFHIPKNQNPLLKDEDFQLQRGFCTKDRLDQLREVDNIVLQNLHSSSWYDKIFQHLTIDLPFAASENHASFVLRPVCSEDVMTARFAWFPKELIEKILSEIASLDFVDAVYFDITNKPPATFGWE